MAGHQIFLAAVTVVELRYGALVAGWGEQRRQGLEQSIAATTVVPVSDPLLTAAAKLRHACRLAGHALHEVPSTVTCRSAMASSSADWVLAFDRDGRRFADRQTGSVWNLFGEAVDGPLTGFRLTPVPHLDTFWFAWSTYQPDTRLVR